MANEDKPPLEDFPVGHPLRGASRALQHHFVMIYAEIELDGKVMRSTYSGFLMSVDGQWIVVTAGHALENINHFIEKGYQTKRFYLVDGVDPPTNAVRIAWEVVKPWFIHERGLDYGVLFLDYLTVRNLEANGKTAFDERNYDFTPDKEGLIYAMYGVREADTVATEPSLRAGISIWMLERLRERPEDIDEPEVDSFYARVIAGAHSMVGMSGAPIFVFGSLTATESRYWIRAVQSRQVQQGKYRIIVAPMIQPLVELIRAEVAKRRAIEPDTTA
jgi:hypothetical protein